MKDKYVNICLLFLFILVSGMAVNMFLPKESEIEIYSKNYTADTIHNRQKEMGEIVINKIEESQDNFFAINCSCYNFFSIYYYYMDIFDKNYDNNSNTITTVQELQESNYTGDCEDYAIFFYVIAEYYDLNPRFVLGHNAINGTVNEGHAWIQIKINNEWYDFDSTADNICYQCVEENFEYISYIET